MPRIVSLTQRFCARYKQLKLERDAASALGRCICALEKDDLPTAQMSKPYRHPLRSIGFRRVPNHNLWVRFTFDDVRVNILWAFADPRKSRSTRRYSRRVHAEAKAFCPPGALSKLIDAFWTRPGFAGVHKAEIRRLRETLNAEDDLAAIADRILRLANCASKLQVAESAFSPGLDLSERIAQQVILELPPFVEHNDAAGLADLRAPFRSALESFVPFSGMLAADSTMVEMARAAVACGWP